MSDRLSKAGSSRDKRLLHVSTPLKVSVNDVRRLLMGPGTRIELSMVLMVDGREYMGWEIAGKLPIP